MSDNKKKDEQDKKNKLVTTGKFAYDTLTGAIPFASGFFAALKNSHSDKQQKDAFNFLNNWLEMLQDEMKEKSQTIVEIAARINLQDEKVAKKISGSEFQSLTKKAFRDWGASESEDKRVYIRNILSNAAVDETTGYSYDVIRMFLDWIKNYSELHFKIISIIYTNPGINRRDIWEKLGREQVRENSADADLYRLIIRDLSTGGIIRQKREVNSNGQFLKQKTLQGKSSKSTTMESAFENTKKYELTNLGQNFVHYAMTEVPIKIDYQK